MTVQPITRQPAPVSRETGMRGTGVTPQPELPGRNQGSVPGTAPSVPMQDRDALAIIRTLFADIFGGALADLAERFWQAYLNDTPIEVIIAEVRKTPEHAAVFPGFTEVKEKNPGFTEAQWIGLTRSYVAEYRQRGVRPGFYDEPADFKNLILNEVAPGELGNRLDLWSTWERETRDPVAAEEYRRQAAALGVDLTDGDFLSLAIDPERAVTAIERSVRAAQVGTEARRSAFGSLTVEEGLRLADLGVGQDEARQGFDALAGSRELFSSLPGEAGDTISRDEQLGAAFGGDAAARRRIEQQQRRRLAAFQGGGGYSAGGGSLSGLAPA